MAKVTPTSTWVVKGFPGGLNTEYDEHLRNPNEAETTNFTFGRDGGAVVRKGLDLLSAHDSWTGGPPATNLRLASMFPFVTSTGKKFLIAVGLDGKVWRTGDGPTGSLVACNIDSSGPVQINLGAPPIAPDGAVLDDYFVLVCEDQHSYFWDGSSTYWTEVTDHTLNDGGTSGTWEFPIASTVCSAFGRMWAAGNDSFPSRLFWSGAVGTSKAGSADDAGPWNWPTANWVEVNPEDGGAITKIIPFGQAIIVFKTNSTYAYVGVGDPDSARLYPLHQQVGCTLPATAATATGRLFWCSVDGAYQYDGSGISRIDEKVRSALADLADDTYAMWANAFTLDERYHLLMPSTSTSTNTVAHYVYDSESQRWEYHTDGGWGSATILDQPYVTRWGGVFKMWGNDGWDDTYSAVGAAVADTVDATLKTAWLPPPENRTGTRYRVRRMDLYLGRPTYGATGSDNQQIPCKYAVRLYTNYAETTKVIGYELNIDTIKTVAEDFVVSLPGYSALVDAFRLVIVSVPPTSSDTGTERLAVNGLAVLLSERAAKRSVGLVSGASVESS
jgi:hypothetical protein